MIRSIFNPIPISDSSNMIDCHLNVHILRYIGLAAKKSNKLINVSAYDFPSLGFKREYLLVWF